MESVSDVLSKTLINTGIATIIAYIIFKLMYPSGRANSATDLGRKFFIWMLVSATVTTLPKYFHQTNLENLIRWFAVALGGGLAAFIVGYVVFYLRNSGTVVKGVMEQGTKMTSALYKGVTDLIELGGEDDKFYEIALIEIESNNLHKITWSKALAKSEGDPEKCKSIYIKSRVAYFQALKKRKSPEINNINIKSTSWVKRHKVTITIIIFVVISFGAVEHVKNNDPEQMYKKAFDLRWVDDKKALNLFLEAAYKGHLDAQFQVGVSYFEGLGVEKNIDMAIYWFLTAANQGYTRAENSLGMFYSEENYLDCPKSLHWHMSAAEKNDSSSQYELGNFFEVGKCVQQDINSAILWYKKVAEKNDPNDLYIAMAQTALGRIYFYGEHFPADYLTAANWFYKAAYSGQDNHGLASFMLGEMYFEGLGVKKNVPEALELLKKSASQGFDKAKKHLAEMGVN